MESALERDVEAYLHPPTIWGFRLHFPAALEARYELERLDARSRQVLFTGALAIIFYDLFLFADYSKHPSVIWRCILLRLGVTTPVILITEWFVRNRAKAAVRESLVLCSITVANGVVLAISYNLNRIDSMFSQMGFMLIIFFGSLILRQQFAYGVATTVFMLLEDMLFLATDRWMTVDDKITSVFMIVTSMILSLIANYMMERQERLAFVHSLKEGFHSKALSRLNLKLTALSQVDGLTGLSNRRHFDEQFHKIWQEAVEEKTALSLLMIDIDHFKKLNDTFGHIAGDRVLIQMGQLLAASVRSADDLVARFGGEEFILLMAGASHKDAHEIAEDLRLLVCTSPTAPREGDEVLRTISVSCGLATITPTEDDDRLKLVGEADLALYAAKRGGRNRVACRVCEELPSHQRWYGNATANASQTLGPSEMQSNYLMSAPSRLIDSLR